MDGAMNLTLSQAKKSLAAAFHKKPTSGRTLASLDCAEGRGKWQGKEGSGGGKKCRR